MFKDKVGTWDPTWYKTNANILDSTGCLRPEFPSSSGPSICQDPRTLNTILITVTLPDSEKNSKIFLFVLAQLTNVTDGQTDGHRMPTYTALMHMHLAVKTTRMHQKSPFGDLKSKHFLGRGHCPSPDPFLSWERDTPSPHLTPSAPTVPRLSRLRRSTSAFDVPHPYYFFYTPPVFIL